MKLINPKLSRDEVSNYITIWECKDCLPYGETQFVMAVDDLAYLPTIDAIPVKYGKWIPVDADKIGYTDKFECSVCKSVVKLYTFSKVCEYDYCPFCTATMDCEDVEEVDIEQVIKNAVLVANEEYSEGSDCNETD